DDGTLCQSDERERRGICSSLDREELQIPRFARDDKTAWHLCGRAVSVQLGPARISIGATIRKDSTSPMLCAGNPFPNFSLPNQDGKIVTLSDFAGQWLVIYFYPKDDTPGCTIQAKSFTATKADFDAAGVN